MPSNMWIAYVIFKLILSSTSIMSESLIMKKCEVQMLSIIQSRTKKKKEKNANIFDTSDNHQMNIE